MITEEASKIVTSVVDSMKTNPMLLAAILFNLMFVVIVYLAIKNNRESIYGIQRTIIENSAKQDERLHDLLQACMSFKKTDL